MTCSSVLKLKKGSGDTYISKWSLLEVIPIASRTVTWNNGHSFGFWNENCETFAKSSLRFIPLSPDTLWLLWNSCSKVDLYYLDERTARLMARYGHVHVSCTEMDLASDISKWFAQFVKLAFPEDVVSFPCSRKSFRIVRSILWTFLVGKERFSDIMVSYVRLKFVVNYSLVSIVSLHCGLSTYPFFCFNYFPSLSNLFILFLTAILLLSFTSFIFWTHFIFSLFLLFNSLLLNFVLCNLLH